MEAPHQKFLASVDISPDYDSANKLFYVKTQIVWLREIGFRDVDCFWKWLEVAVLAWNQAQYFALDHPGLVGYLILANTGYILSEGGKKLQLYVGEMVKQCKWRKDLHCNDGWCVS